MLNRKTKLHKKPILKRTTPTVRSSTLRNLAIAFAIVLLAAFTYVKLEPHTHDAKVKTELESKSHQLIETKSKLEAQQTRDAEAQKQLQELNRQLQETQKQLQAKQATQKAYAASVGNSGSCVEWMAQAGIPNTYATNKLIVNESGCRPNAMNSSSGACGIPQALPCSKLPCSLDSAGAVCQLKWMDTYVKNRYGSWDSALAAWNSRSPHWY